MSPPSDHASRRESSPTKPDDPDLHTESRLVQSLPSCTRQARHCNAQLSSVIYCTFLSVGGSSNEHKLYSCSETVCDITNELLHCEGWDPSEVYSPMQNQILSTPSTMNSSTPFAGALPLAIDVPIESIGKGDNNIDDLISSLSCATPTASVAATPQPKGTWKKSK
jgi:hypothetical protein